MGALEVVAAVYVFVQPTISVCVVVLNCLLIIALAKSRSLQAPSNTVLGCLCSCDLLIGILTLFLWGLNISMTFSNSDYESRNLFSASAKVYLGFTGLSSLFMVMVSLDRYAAICHPYQYLGYSTPKLYTIISASASTVYAIVIILAYVMDNIYDVHVCSVIYAITFIATTTILIYCNWKIWRVIRRHRREIASVERHGDISSETKRYRIIIILTILYAVCKLPLIMLYLLLFIRNFGIIEPLRILGFVSDILLVLNSFLNPLVFCFRITGFRNAVKKLLCCQRPV